MNEANFFPFCSLDEATEYYKKIDLNQLDEEDLRIAAYTASTMRFMCGLWEDFEKDIPFWEGLYQEVVRIMKNRHIHLVRLCMNDQTILIIMINEGGEEQWRRDFTETVLAKYDLKRLENWLDDEITQPCVCTLLTDLLVEEIEKRTKS